MDVEGRMHTSSGVWLPPMITISGNLPLFLTAALLLPAAEGPREGGEGGRA
jgi:hypothetical protein